ncbi:hypothetical protein BST81_08410 [Leptolyngbya sp. 'hensonii']|uniref:O-antigen ligase family protein n=1 Tax=Leptolyngbya sp. 'hensonii' TaxID=1922337 RepID=UPI0009500AC9|nr:O-antigen ligase family protein [Leptolyngbya sp. 'hensonii']OLP18925.1 hypothetical protein BST81_08410 [Leptolyngbya sp. 'hensonii']
MNPLNLLQPHPDPSLQRQWVVVQISLLLLPISPLLGGMSILMTAISLWPREYRLFLRRPVTWGISGLILWTILISFWAEDPPTAFLGLYNFFPGFIIFVAGSHLLQTPAQLRQFSRLVLLSAVPVVLVGFGQLFWGWAGHPRLLWIVVDLLIDAGGNPPGRMSSIFSYANFLASFLVIVFGLGLGLWLETWHNPPIAHGEPKLTRANIQAALRSPRSLLLLSFLGTVALAIVLTQSRNAWVIAFLISLAFALYQGWRWLVAGVMAIAGCVLGAVWAPNPLGQWLRIVVPAFIWARLSGDLYPNQSTALHRETQWQFAWWMTEQRPWTGWGLRSFPDLYQAQTGVWLGHPHNLFLMLTAEAGIPTTLLLLTVVGWVFCQGVGHLLHWPGQPDGPAKTQADRLLYFSFLVTFIGCTLFSLVDVTLFDVRITMVTWLVLAGIDGLACRVPQINRRDSDPPGSWLKY